MTRVVPPGSPRHRAGNRGIPCAGSGGHPCRVSSDSSGMIASSVSHSSQWLTRLTTCRGAARTAVPAGVSRRTRATTHPGISRPACWPEDRSGHRPLSCRRGCQSIRHRSPLRPGMVGREPAFRSRPDLLPERQPRPRIPRRTSALENDESQQIVARIARVRRQTS
jgi:hypothetical protein